MSDFNFFLSNLARAFLAGTWTLKGLLKRGREACDGRARWLRPLVRRILATFPEPSALPDEDRLKKHLHRDSEQYSWPDGEEIHRVFWGTPQMTTAPWIPAGELPVLRTSTDVAAWLGLEPAELDWFATPAWRARAIGEAGNHYTYHWMRKRSGQPRLIEAPKGRLKAIQHRILHDVLDKLPPHEAAHGYCRGRSILTYTTPHVARPIILRFDLRDFFPSIPASRVHALFRRIGYPRDVTRILTRLCTNAMPAAIWEQASEGACTNAYRFYESPHLPQGSPTSPALANLCAYRLDCRMAGLARAMNARYTRYADDLALSGGANLERSRQRLHVLVGLIALEEGFEVHTRKTRFMRQGVRQQLAGVVLNARLNIRRAEYDRLKAILHNCLQRGPASQNRDGHADFRAHLLGRINYVAQVHPQRGQKLRVLFDRIMWDEDPKGVGNP